MEAEYQLTAEEAEKEMEHLRKVFTIVSSCRCKWDSVFGIRKAFIKK